MACLIFLSPTNLILFTPDGALRFRIFPFEVGDVTPLACLLIYSFADLSVEGRCPLFFEIRRVRLFISVAFVLSIMDCAVVYMPLLGEMVSREYIL